MPNVDKYMNIFVNQQYVWLMIQSSGWLQSQFCCKLIQMSDYCVNGNVDLVVEKTTTIKSLRLWEVQFLTSPKNQD